MQTYQNLYTTENIIRNYSLLSSQDSEERQRANKFLMSLADHEETWITCQNMIQSSLDPNFIFLGAQLLYQKIQKDLHQFDPLFRGQLKNFLFAELDSGKHTKTFIIDKLASSAALIVSAMLLNQWQNFVQHLTQFMKKSQNNLLSGLTLLQRIPEELRSTNRISQGIKSKIQQHFLEKQALFAIIFDSVMDLKDDMLIKACLKTMQSWIRVCYPLIKYPNLVQKVLMNSLQNVDKLQICIKVICEAVKLASQQKTPGLTDIDPSKQQQNYSHEQVSSIQSIVSYAIDNKNNFLSLASSQPQYTQIYLQLVEELLLSFGFLILQPLGFQLLFIVKEMTKSKDLKLSFSTFQFWTDFSQKVTRIKLNEQIKSKIFSQFVSLLDMFSEKLLIQNDTLMTDADLKDDDTVDDADGITFTQYRQDAGNLLRAIYDYFVKSNKQNGASIYFKKIVQLIQCDSPPLTRYTQLALYMLKSPLQSMINPYETAHLTEILSHLILGINSTPKQAVAPIVLGETMNFIRDCTREIKEKDQLFLQALKLVLNFINDEKLCHHAAYCFQILMETISTLNDPSIAEGLVEFYREKRFTKQVVLEKMLEGIFNAVIKVPDQSKVELYIDIILQTLMGKYQHSITEINGNDIFKHQSVLGTDGSSQLYLTLVELKSLLDSYDSASNSVKSLYKNKFINLANHSIEIVNQILPIGISSGLKFSSVNQVGLAVSVYRVALKIIQIPQQFLSAYDGIPTFIKSLNTVLMVFNQKDINEYFYLLTILSETLIQFINHASQPLNQWLKYYLPSICGFFNQYFYSSLVDADMLNKSQIKLDPDVLKSYFTLLQGLVLYNKSILEEYDRKEQVLKLALSSLKTINERNMQRKCVSFILVSLQNQIYVQKSFEQIVQNVFTSIPIIHSMCYTNLAKILRILFASVSVQKLQAVFLALLGLNPYGNIEQPIKSLLAKAIAMALATKQERNIKTTFVQLHEVVWKKTGGDILMQLQLKIATWKREYNKKLQQQQQQLQQQQKI